MKVKCVTSFLAAEQRLKRGARSASDSIKFAVTKDKEYVVLGIEFILPNTPHEGGISYHVIDDGNRWMPIPSDLFEISDPRLSRRWQVQQVNGGSVYLGPPEFSDRFFFDDFTNGHAKRNETFHAVAEALGTGDSRKYRQISCCRSGSDIRSATPKTSLTPSCIKRRPS
jgi:hypothetical protein